MANLSDKDSSSPPTPRSTSDSVLTPSRKVRALLAQFEDSGSDDSDSAPSVPSVTHVERIGQSRSTEHPVEEESDNDDDDALPLPPKSRMAARLHGHSLPKPTATTVPTETDEASRRAVSDPTRKRNYDVSTPSSEDELAKPAPKRRLLTKRKSSPIPTSDSLARNNRSVSPLFFNSPHVSRDGPRTSPPRYGSDSDSLPDNPASEGNSRFLALVEKHRKQRLEKEAAEQAKRKAQAQTTISQPPKSRKQRGSSPADDTEEDSDVSNSGAAERLTKEARPSRKASKKAIEEMNRETQRMSRNMQLAHQARTKKKITKESLLARFNFAVPVNDVAIAKAVPPNSASSAPSSNAGDVDRQSTPPTSPFEDIFPEKQAQEDRVVTGIAEHSSVSGNTRIEQITYLNSEHDDTAKQVDKGKGRAFDSMAQLGNNKATQPVPKLSRLDRTELALRVASIAPGPDDDDSDSDLEIVTSRGHVRKYAAFEQLPKRKARETQSHLALRALAHIAVSNEKKRSTMTSSDMEASLRKAARMQALAERQQRIEELKAKGIIVQTAEERERDQQEVEDLVERARQEAAEISKREKAMAKKDGTFVKDGLDDEDSDDEDDDFQEEDVDEDDDEEDEDEDEESDGAGSAADETSEKAKKENEFVDMEAEDTNSENESDIESEADLSNADEAEPDANVNIPRISRTARVIVDDDDDSEIPAVHRSPGLPATAKTPQSLVRSARKQIPGLNMSDDLELGLTQAFAATMADSQSQTSPEIQDQDSLEMTRDLPSPNIPFVPRLSRLDSIDMVSESQPATQTQPLNVNLSFSQSQPIPESPAAARRVSVSQFTPSQLPFEPTQDGGYVFSPFHGNRFISETPQPGALHSTIDTVVLPEALQNSPIMQRKGRLRRGRVEVVGSDDEAEPDGISSKSAFEEMRRAAKKAEQAKFDKTKSHAKDIIDEAAEESEDEYAGLGGASDDDVDDEENEDDRRMIDEDTQIGEGDEAKLAGLHADRERQQDEAAVSKLLKDITTGALRRKRGVNDDLDLSDEEDAAARRREAKRREFAKMRRELLKDEAVGKIAEDKKKEAFLKSIEDREEMDNESDNDDLDRQPESLDESQEAAIQQNSSTAEDTESQGAGSKRKRVLDATSESQLNRLPPALRRTIVTANRRPTTLAEIRDSVSFLIEEPDSQASMIDLGLSDSEEEPEAYVDLDRHLKSAEADENAEADDFDDLGDFVVDDDGLARPGSQDNEGFKKPTLPPRAPFSERRTKERANVVNRLNLMRQASSSASATSISSSNKLAFFTSKSSSMDQPFSKVPTLLRRATSNSSSFKFNSSETVSATGVVTSNNRTERGSVSEEKEFVRKGSTGRRNAVNYRPTVKEERMAEREGAAQRMMAKSKNKKANGSFLGGLFRGDSWD